MVLRQREVRGHYPRQHQTFQVQQKLQFMMCLRPGRLQAPNLLWTYELSAST